MCREAGPSPNLCSLGAGGDSAVGGWGEGPLGEHIAGEGLVSVGDGVSGAVIMIMPMRMIKIVLMIMKMKNENDIDNDGDNDTDNANENDNNSHNDNDHDNSQGTETYDFAPACLHACRQPI